MKPLLTFLCALVGACALPVEAPADNPSPVCMCRIENVDNSTHIDHACSDPDTEDSCHHKCTTDTTCDGVCWVGYQIGEFTLAN